MTTFLRSFLLLSLALSPLTAAAVPFTSSQEPAHTALRAIPPVTAQDHVRGKRAALLTLVEYADYECPFSKAFAPTVKKLLRAYKGTIGVVYRHFPLAIHAHAQELAEAAECASQQRGEAAFWNFTDAVFDGGQTDYRKIAADLGLNTTSFNLCMAAHTTRALVTGEKHAADGLIPGTPTTFVFVRGSKSSERIVGAASFENIKKGLDTLLKTAK